MLIATEFASWLKAPVIAILIGIEFWRYLSISRHCRFVTAYSAAREIKCRAFGDCAHWQDSAVDRCEFFFRFGFDFPAILIYHQPAEQAHVQRRGFHPGIFLQFGEDVPQEDGA